VVESDFETPYKLDDIPDAYVLQNGLTASWDTQGVFTKNDKKNKDCPSLSFSKKM
jgi:hypothetical protein